MSAEIPINNLSNLELRKHSVLFLCTSTYKSEGKTLIDVVDALAQVVGGSVEALEVEHGLFAIHLAFILLSKTLELSSKFVVDTSNEFRNLGIRW
jgi:hypothetical protein